MNNFSDIDKLSPQDFEDYVARLFTSLDWKDMHITTPGKDRTWGDGGVDLIATRNGRKFAFEVKHRSESESRVGVDALNQLVTGAELLGIRMRILVTNAYFTQEVHSRAVQLGVDLVDRDELKSLVESGLAEIGRRIQPRGYQAAVVGQVREKNEAGISEFLLEMATGLGKTYTCAFIVRDFISRNGAQKMLFVAHQKELITQAVRSFRNVFGLDGPSLSPCLDGEQVKPTDFVFATFQTLHSQRETLKEHGFDILVVDEAHHIAARTYAEVKDSLNPELTVGMTATPFRLDGADVLGAFGGTNGHVGRYGLAWALKHGHLAKPRYHVLADDLDEQKLKSLDYSASLGDLNKRLFLHRRDDQIVQILEENVQSTKKVNAKFSPQAIVYCRNIRHIESLLSHFQPGSATAVHSRMNRGQREACIRAFREGEYSYILTCDLFNEGVDIPETNTLVFLRPTSSPTIFLQQLGRGLRKTKSKRECHVFDFVASLENMSLLTQLQEEVETTPFESANLAQAEDGFEENEEHHDYSLDVNFSRQAARVADIVRDLSLKLVSAYEVSLDYGARANAAGKPLSAPEYFERSQYRPEQIGALFGSFLDMARQSGSTQDEIEILMEEVKETALDQQARFGVSPDSAALVSATEYAGLPLITLDDAEEILTSLERTGGYPSSRTERTDPIPTSESAEVRAEHLAYELGITSADFDRKQLTEEEQQRIKSEFGGLYLFREILRRGDRQ